MVSNPCLVVHLVALYIKLMKLELNKCKTHSINRLVPLVTKTEFLLTLSV